MHYYYGGGLGFLWMFIMLLLWIFIIGIIIWLVIYAIRKSENKTYKNHEKDALETAKKRYAKGEITKKEYEEIKKELSKK